MTRITIAIFSATIFTFFISTSANPIGSTLSAQVSSRNKHYFVDKDEYQEEINTNEIIQPDGPTVKNFQKCSLPTGLIEEIASYRNISNLIIQEATVGAFKGRAYKDLSYFVDKFGSRIAGSRNLEKSIDFMIQKMKDDNLENVHGEEVSVPHWVRGEESAYMILPHKKKLNILGLGYSVGTPSGGIEAEILVVRNFNDLKLKAQQAQGKIIVFNEEYESYGVTVKYRDNGASEAAKVGGLAVLVRSVTPFSINSPHTGMMDYETNVTKIPAACITTEDAEMFQRMQDRGWKIVVDLKMGAKALENTMSRNVIGEIVGNNKEEEVIVVSGHIDSWDVGQGAMDDGGGAMISVQALALLKHLNLRPRRTLRSILWTAEEEGLIGVLNYVSEHGNELDNFKAVFESDIGTFKPLGLDFAGTFEAGCIIQEVLKLLKPINASTFRAMPDVGSDIGFFIDGGVPGLSLNNENDKYFYYHHSEGDMMTVENSDELDLCTAVWTVASYVLADISVTLPRHPELQNN